MKPETNRDRILLDEVMEEPLPTALAAVSLEAGVGAVRQRRRRRQQLTSVSATLLVLCLVWLALPKPPATDDASVASQAVQQLPTAAAVGPGFQVVETTGSLTLPVITTRSKQVVGDVVAAALNPPKAARLTTIETRPDPVDSFSSDLLAEMMQNASMTLVDLSPESSVVIDRVGSPVRLLALRAGVGVTRLAPF